MQRKRDEKEGEAIGNGNGYLAKTKLDFYSGQVLIKFRKLEENLGERVTTTLAQSSAYLLPSTAWISPCLPSASLHAVLLSLSTLEGWENSISRNGQVGTFANFICLPSAWYREAKRNHTCPLLLSLLFLSLLLPTVAPLKKILEKMPVILISSFPPISPSFISIMKYLLKHKFQMQAKKKKSFIGKIIYW